MTTNRRAFSIAVAASMATSAGLTARAQVSNSRVLKFNHTDTPSSSRHRAAVLFASRLEEYTAGRYRVLVFHSGQLGNDTQAIKDVAAGKLEFTTSATGSFAGLVPELNLTALPYLVDSYEQGWRFYDNSVWLQRNFANLNAKGIHRLATWETGFRSFTTRSPLVTPADAKGKKIRIFSNEMIRWIVESVGFTAEVIPVTEVYAAIQQGRVEGQENPIDTIRSLRFYEVAPHVALTQHVYSPSPLVVSESLWKGLTPAEQQAFSKAASESAALSRNLVRQSDEINLAAMATAGAKVTRPDIAAFKKAMSSVNELARQKYGSDVDAILKDAADARR